MHSSTNSWSTGNALLWALLVLQSQKVLKGWGSGMVLHGMHYILSDYVVYTYGETSVQ